VACTIPELLDELLDDELLDELLEEELLELLELLEELLEEEELPVSPPPQPNNAAAEIRDNAISLV